MYFVTAVYTFPVFVLHCLTDRHERGTIPLIIVMYLALDDL